MADNDSLDHSRPLPPKRRSVAAHGDFLAEAGLDGSIRAALTIYITKDGLVRSRWTGFDNSMELLGTLDSGGLAIKQHVFKMMNGG
jgi:hypothetical protein